MRESKQDRLLSAIIVIVMTCFALCFIIPFLLVLGTSLVSAEEYAARGMVIIPHEPTLATYKLLLTTTKEIWTAMAVSVFRTVFGTALSLITSAMLAYGLSKPVPGRNVVVTMLFITLIFNGGLIPNYILASNLRLTDTIWCMILPNMINGWNVFVLRNFFNSLPSSLEEAAIIDGASQYQIFSKIYLPLSKPALVTIGIYYAVANWNSWFDAAIYINKKIDLWPLQLIVKKYVASADTYALQSALVGGVQRPPSMTIKACVIVITALPMLLVYPFLQKYFVKGIIMGSVKE